MALISKKIVESLSGRNEKTFTLDMYNFDGMN